MTNQNSDLESRTSDGWTKKEHHITVIATLAATGLFIVGANYLAKEDRKMVEYRTEQMLKVAGYSDESIKNFIKEERRFANLAQNLEEFKSRFGANKTEIDYELYLEKMDYGARKASGAGLYRDEMGRLYWAPLTKKGMQ